MNLTLEQARRHWCHAQGLASPHAGSVHDLLVDTGWIRSLGGIEAYLGIAVRSLHGVDAVTAAVASGDVQILPSVRGCIYLVPREHAALSLRIADLLSARRNERDMEKAGIGPGDLETAASAVLELLSDGKPRSTRKLGSDLPDGVVKKLGDAGKKVGITSTLPPALRQLEFAGKLSRRVQDDRLDHERYEWHIPETNALEAAEHLSEEAVYAAVAELYFRWAGPATRKGFAAWSGLNQTQAKAAIAAAALVEVEVEGMGESFMLESRLDAELPAPEELNWVPALDNLLALQEEATYLIDPEHHDVDVAQFGRTSTRKFVEVNQPLQRTLFWDGRAVGLWAFSPSEGQVVHTLFGNAPSAPALSGLERARSVIDHFGHAKAFSLDKDDTLEKRAALVRAAEGR